MPDAALPIPRGSRPGRNLFVHLYTDPLGQPLTGTVTIACTKRVEQSGEVVPDGATADVELVDGLLQAHLRPGYYTLTARLQTPAGQQLTDESTITVAG